MSVESIAVIGLGNMGAPIARNLLASEFSLSVFNRSRGKAEPLAVLGARAADSPAQAVTPGGVVVTVLSNDAVLEASVLGEGGFADRLGAGGLHISMSTVSPETSKRLAAEHARRGSLFVAAPMFGRPDAAAARKLHICASGAAEAKARAWPILEALGQRVQDFGEGPGQANIVKLSGNFMIASAIEAMAEAMALCEKSGIERSAVYDFFTKANFACPVYQSYGRVLVGRTYEPAGFLLELGRKDMRLARESAAAVGVPMPLADLLFLRLEDAVKRGRGQLDWSAIELATAEAAGIDVAKAEVQRTED
ncbi:putative oxidoreductase YfjR [Betaproteobacteria bacterium]|nr:putative oxidoreductase YfjR [Betaproteobacteria bacterium]